LLVLVRLETDTTAWRVFVDVAVATGGLRAASLFADYVAHLAAHGSGPRGREAGSTLHASGRSWKPPTSRCCSWPSPASA
jgi:hypothetical protein